MPLTGEYEPSPAQFVREQVEAFEHSAGREANDMKGVPVILLTTKGVKTGKLRKTPLMRVEHEGEYAVVASLGGAPKHPVWYHNIIAEPHVELQDGAVRRDYTARELKGDEREEWWQRAAQVWPDYDVYQTKTDRVIPIFVLTPR
jgi:F420H(2)-dependent quinone reductase